MQINARNLSRSFNDGKNSKLAVKNVSLQIRQGQILGLLGPNGSGKSTIIKMLSGQITPTSGEIEIEGETFKFVPSNFRSKIGVMPQEIVIWDKLTLHENLLFTGSLQGMSKQQIKENTDILIAGLNLQSELNTLAINLSGGYKRRLNLAISIIHNPSMVFLDEPSPGIDPQSRIFLWDFIKNLKNQNKAVILTDHYLEEAEKLCDYVVIIDDGLIIAEGTVDELKEKYGNGTLLEVKVDSLNSEQILGLELLFPTAIFSEKGFSLLAKNSNFVLQELLPALANLNVQTNNLEMREPSLEDIFLILTGKEIRE